MSKRSISMEKSGQFAAKRKMADINADSEYFYAYVMLWHRRSLILQQNQNKRHYETCRSIEYQG